eukprot:403365646
MIQKFSKSTKIPNIKIELKQVQYKIQEFRDHRHRKPKNQRLIQKLKIAYNPSNYLKIVSLKSSIRAAKTRLVKFKRIYQKRLQH